MVIIKVNKGDADVKAEGGYSEVLAELTIATQAIIETIGENIQSDRDAKVVNRLLAEIISGLSVKERS